MTEVKFIVFRANKRRISGWPYSVDKILQGMNSVLKTEKEEGSHLTLLWLLFGLFLFVFPPKVPSFSVASPNYSRPYMVMGGFGGKVKVAAEGGKKAFNGKE